jgi:arsenate reductase
VITLYGIKNCDTVKKARRWMEQHAIDYQFHDFRVDGLEPEQVQAWLDELGWESLVNRRSTTWKQLDPAVRDSLNASTVLPLILEQPTLVKRPLLDTGAQRYVGFKTTEYQAIFKQHTL